MRIAPEDKKKVLILITDGADSASSYRFAQILRMAQTRNVQIYAIGLFDRRFGIPFSIDPYGPAVDTKTLLTRLAQETGGVAYFPKNSGELARVCLEIAAGIRHQYTLGYAPKDMNRSGYRKLSVEVVGQGKLLAQTRTGYFLPAKSEAVPTK